jgi:DNA polymerase-3 subunit delta
LSTVAAVRKQIGAGTAAPVYLLQGEDDVEKSALAHEFEQLVEEGLRPFNVERIHAGDLTSGDKLAAAVGALVASARTLPMMSPRRIVMVLQAEGMLAPKRESDAASRALDELERLVKQPEETTTIVFVAGVLDKRGRLYKLLVKLATVVECGVLEDAADAERWIQNRMAAAGVEIDPSARRLLAARSGPDVRRLRNDIERLLLYTLGQKSVTLDDVRQIAGPAALQDDWAMTSALEAGDGAEALRQLALMMDAGVAPEKVLGQLGWLVRSRLPLSPPALRAAIGAVFRTDLDLKRSAGEPRILLERLIIEVCGMKGPMIGRRAST